MVRRWLAWAGIAFITSLVGAGTAAALGWTDAKRLADAPAGSVAVGGRYGHPLIAVWSVADPIGSTESVVWAMRGADHRWGAPTPVDARPQTSVSELRFESDWQGRGAAVWVVGAGSPSAEIRAATLDWYTMRWSVPQTVATGDIRAVDVYSDAQTHSPAIAWTERAPGGVQVSASMAMSFDATSWGPPESIAAPVSGTITDLAIRGTTYPTDHMAVTWTRNDGATCSVEAAVKLSGMAGWNRLTLASGEVRALDITFDVRGRAAAAWLETVSGTSRVHVALKPTEAASWDAPFELAPTALGDATTARFGTISTTWTDQPSFGLLWGSTTRLPASHVTASSPAWWP